MSVKIGQQLDFPLCTVIMSLLMGACHGSRLTVIDEMSPHSLATTIEQGQSVVVDADGVPVAGGDLTLADFLEDWRLHPDHLRVILESLPRRVGRNFDWPGLVERVLRDGSFRPSHEDSASWALLLHHTATHCASGAAAAPNWRGLALLAPRGIGLRALFEARLLDGALPYDAELWQALVTRLAARPLMASVASTWILFSQAAVKDPEAEAVWMPLLTDDAPWERLATALSQLTPNQAQSLAAARAAALEAVAFWHRAQEAEESREPASEAAVADNAATAVEYGDVFLEEQRRETPSDWLLSAGYTYEMSNPSLRIHSAALSATRRVSRHLGLGVYYARHFTAEMEQRASSSIVMKPSHSAFATLTLFPLSGYLALFERISTSFDVPITMGAGAAFYESMSRPASGIKNVYPAMRWSMGPQLFLSKRIGVSLAVGQTLEGPFTTDYFTRLDLGASVVVGI